MSEVQVIQKEGYKEIKPISLFAFTLKINDKKEPKHEDYVKIIQKMSTKVEMVDFVFEDKDKKGFKAKLHIHGIFECPKNPYFKSVIGSGVSVKVERIYDYTGWEKYMKKNKL